MSPSQVPSADCPEAILGCDIVCCGCNIACCLAGFPLVEAKMCPHAECGPYGKHSGEGAKGQIVLASTSARHATLVTHGAAFSPGKRIVEFKYGYQFLQEVSPGAPRYTEPQVRCEIECK